MKQINVSTIYRILLSRIKLETCYKSHPQAIIWVAGTCVMFLMHSIDELFALKEVSLSSH